MLATLPPEQAQDLLRDCPELFDTADDGFTSIRCELNAIRRMRGLSFDRGGGMPGVGSVACVDRPRIRSNVGVPRDAVREWLEGPYGGGCCGKRTVCSRRGAVDLR